MLPCITIQIPTPPSPSPCTILLSLLAYRSCFQQDTPINLNFRVFFQEAHLQRLVSGIVLASGIPKTGFWELPCGLVVKNPPSDSGVMGSIPGWGTKILHVLGQQSLCPQISEPTRWSPHALWSPRTASRETPVYCNKRSQMPQLRSEVTK